ncbi:MAG TPA: PAS domain S-box protein [Flavisolibacter sp.]
MLPDNSTRDNPWLVSAALLEQLALPVWIIEAASFRIRFSNTAAALLYGYSPEEFSSLDLLSLFDEDGRIRFFNSITARQKGKGLYRLSARNGNPLMIELYLSPVSPDNNEIWQLVSVDMTRQLGLQQSLEEEKKRYKSYIDQCSEGIFCQELRHPIPIEASLEEFLERMRKDSYLSECNDAMASMYGFARAEELYNLPADQMMDFSDPANTESYRGFRENNFMIVNAETHEKDSFGNDRYFLNNAIGIVEDGCLRRIWGTQRDITAQKQTEERIRLLASLVEQTSDILTASDLDFKPITWNRAAEEIYGLKADQVIGKDLRTLIGISYPGYTREEVRQAIIEQGEWRGEMHFTRPTDGRKVMLLINFRLLKNEKDQPLGYVIGATDITEWRAAELRLKETETRFRDVADSAPVMIWISNAENRMTYVNRTLVRNTGFEPDETGQKKWVHHIHPEDAEAAGRTFDEHFDRRQPVVLIYRLRYADVEGNYRWVQETGTPRFLDDGTFIGFIGSVIDIHDHKLKEAQLRYQAGILENVSDVIITTDLEHNVLSWNKLAEKYYNIPAAEALGRPVTKLLYMEFREGSFSDALEVLNRTGVWKGEVSYTGPQGTAYFSYTAKFLSDPEDRRTGILVVGQDITEMKLAGQKLTASEQFYRSLISYSLDGMVLCNHDGIISFASPSVKNVLGYEADEAAGHNIFSYVHPDDHSKTIDGFQRELAGNAEVNFVVSRLKKKSGEWQWCVLRANNLLDNPYVNSVVIYFYDDTLRKQATDALKESEQRFRTLLRDLRTGVLLMDAEGYIQMANNSAYTIAGHPEEEMIGRRIWEIVTDAVHEDGRPFTLEERPVYRALRSRQIVRDVVMGFRRPRSAERTWIMITTDPAFDNDGNLLNIVCLFTDITERKKLESRLIAEGLTHQRQLTQATLDAQENERTEIGKELHDNLGQQLTTIKLYLDLAQENSREGSSEMIRMAVKGISRVIDEIRAMSRSLVPSTLRDLGLIDSLHDHIETLKRTHHLNIELSYFGFDEDPLPENRKLAIFRIVQEQLNSIIRRSGAHNIAIELMAAGDAFILEIRDDGRDCDPGILREGTGFSNIRNRAELFGGSAELFPFGHHGCLLRVSLPVPAWN